MTKITWSYSSIELFKQCPHKYYRLRVIKDIQDPPTEHTDFGIAVHKACEDFIGSGVPIPEEYSFAIEPLEKIKKLKGAHFCEYKMGLTRDLESCDFFDKNVWWRGVADFICISDDTAKCIDYKTGKSSKYADTKQLEILSLAIFKHFPQVKKVKAGLIFLVAGDFIPAEYEADKEGVYWTKWLTDAAKLEKAVELQVWNPRPNFTCRGWCPVIDCPHWEPRKK